MTHASMLAGKRAVTGTAIGATTFACCDTGQGSGSIVTTGAAIVLFVIGGRGADTATSTLSAGMTT